MRSSPGTTDAFYYDKDGKQLSKLPDAHNAQPYLKGKETKKEALGLEKSQIPKGTAVIECEVSGGSYSDGKNWKRPHSGFADRPMGGWK